MRDRNAARCRRRVHQSPAVNRWRISAVAWRTSVRWGVNIQRPAVGPQGVVELVEVQVAVAHAGPRAEVARHQPDRLAAVVDRLDEPVGQVQRDRPLVVRLGEIGVGSDGGVEVGNGPAEVAVAQRACPAAQVPVGGGRGHRGGTRSTTARARPSGGRRGRGPTTSGRGDRHTCGHRRARGRGRRPSGRRRRTSRAAGRSGRGTTWPGPCRPGRTCPSPAGTGGRWRRTPRGLA